MDIEKELREAYLSGVTEAQAAAEIKGVRFNFEGMANGYAQTKVKELIIHGVSNRRELLIALENVEKCCDPNNQDHNEIWHIANDAIKSNL